MYVKILIIGRKTSNNVIQELNEVLHQNDFKNYEFYLYSDRYIAKRYLNEWGGLVKKLYLYMPENLIHTYYTDFKGVKDTFKNCIMFKDREQSVFKDAIQYYKDADKIVPCLTLDQVREEAMKMYENQDWCFVDDEEDEDRPMTFEEFMNAKQEVPKVEPVVYGLLNLMGKSKDILNEEDVLHYRPLDSIFTVGEL